MELTHAQCRKCGAKLNIQSDGSYKCEHCGALFSAGYANEIHEQLNKILSEQKQEAVANLRQRLWKETHKKYISNTEVASLCSEILNYLPEDFYAGFYFTTCSKEKTALADFFESVDLDEYRDDIPDICDYLITALRPEWTISLSGLIERFKNSDDIINYNKYRTKYETQYADLEDGVFTPTLHRDIFMCYSSKDMAAVNKLVCELENEGLTCFVAARNLRHGAGATDNYHNAIHSAIENCKIVIFVSSTNSRSVNCEAIDELDYIEKNHPNMGRIEYLIQDYRGFRIERNVKDFFNGLEYCVSIDDTVDRAIKLKKQPKKNSEEELKRQLEQRLAEERERIRREYEQKFAEEQLKQAKEQERLRKETERRQAEEQEYKQAEEHNSDFEIENGVLKIYKGKMANIAIPDGVTAIGGFAFSGCNNLTRVTVPNGVTSIGNSAFGDCVNLKSINIPESVTDVGNNAFYNCSSLLNVKLSDKITAINGSLFNGCRNLMSVNIPNASTAIGDYAFYGCGKLTNVNIPENVTSIGEYAFYGCSSIKSVLIPESVSRIGKKSFQNCSALKTVKCEALAPSQDFAYSWIDNGVEVIWGCSDFEIANGVLKKYKGNRENVIIPNNVTSIACEAFKGKKNLVSITIPDSVKSIGYRAFFGCENLTSVNIPQSVTSLEWGAFLGCKKLVSITIPDGITAINMNTFEHCESLKKVIIPESVSVIGMNAFDSCFNLQWVNIPENVKKLSGGLFSNCKNLKDITFSGSVQKWKILKKGMAWDYNTENYTVHCLDGDIKV